MKVGDRIMVEGHERVITRIYLGGDIGTQRVITNARGDKVLADQVFEYEAHEVARILR